MKVIVPGHQYELANFKSGIETGQLLKFETGKVETIENGTTNEEVLEMMIDRMKFLQGLFPCKENACCITHLEEALMWLEKRRKDREKRGVEGKHIA